MGGKFLQAIRNAVVGGISYFPLYGAGAGYANGGTVTQQTSKSTGVTLNAWCGQITMNNASLASNTSVTFSLTNSAIVAATFEVSVWIVGGNTAGAYIPWVDGVSAGSCRIGLRNVSGGALAEAVVLGFAVRAAATA